MAKNMSFAFNIDGGLGAGFQAAFNTADNAMRKSGITAQQLKEQNRQLGAEMSDLKNHQRLLTQSFNAHRMSESSYKAQMSALDATIKSTAAAQDKLAAATTRAATAQKSQSVLNKAFSAAPVKAFSGAVQGVSGNVSSLTTKLSSMAAYAAGGFGLASLVGSAVDAGENVYQLGVKLHLSSAEAVQMNKIITMTGGSTDAAAKAFLRLDKTFASSGSAGNAMRATLQQYGVELTDASGKMLPLNQQLANLSAGYKKAAAEGREQEFVMQTLGPRGMELTKTLQDYSEAAEDAAKIKGVGLDVNQMHALSREMKVMKAEGSQLGLAFTAAFAPVVQQLMPVLLPALQNAATWIAKNKDMLAAMAVAGVKLMVLYKTATMLTTGFTAVGKAIMAVKTGASAISAISTFANPVTLAIMAVIGVAYLLYTNWGTITSFMSSAWQGACSAISSIWAGFTAILMAGVNLWIAGLKMYINFWLNLPQNIIFAIGFIAGAVSRLPGIIGSMVSASATFLMNLPSAVYNAAAEFITAAIAWGAQAYATVTGWMGNLVTGAGAFLMNLPAMCADAGAAFVSTAEGWASEAYNSIVNWISQIPSAISEYISSTWDNIKSTFSAGFTIGAEAHAYGGLMTQPHLGLVAEAGPEMIIPLTDRDRGTALWQQAGTLLGASSAISTGPQISLQSAPITINGASDPQSTAALVQQAVERSNENLLARLPRILQEIQNNNRRVSFA